MTAGGEGGSFGVLKREVVLSRGGLCRSNELKKPFSPCIDPSRKSYLPSYLRLVGLFVSGYAVIQSLQQDSCGCGVLVKLFLSSVRVTWYQWC